VTLVTLLHLCFQIPRHPSFKRIFYEFSDTSLKKLLSTLRSQKACSSDGDRSLAKRSSPFTFGLVNKLSGSQSRTICSLMGSRGHCDQHNYAQFPQVREGGEGRHPYGTRDTGPWAALSGPAFCLLPSLLSQNF
jgi:hypothetical protein